MGKELEEIVRQLEEANKKFAAENEKLKREKEAWAQQTSTMRPPGENVGNRAKRDLGLQNMIKPWTGAPGSPPIGQFFKKLEKIGAMGNWTEEDHIIIAEQKLGGMVEKFLESKPELVGAGASYESFKTAVTKRFQDPREREKLEGELCEAKQGAAEPAKNFADRVRSIGARLISSIVEEEERGILTKHIEGRVLAAFLRGLRPDTAKFIQALGPSTLQEAISRAEPFDVTEGPNREGRNRREVFGVEAEVPTELNFQDGSRPLGDRGCEINLIRPAERAQFRCYRCGNEGHFARGCLQAPTTSAVEKRGATKPNNKCFSCGGEGHFARECPSQTSTQRYQRKNRNPQSYSRDPKGQDLS